MILSRYNEEFFLLNGIPYKVEDHTYIFINERFDILNKYTGVSILLRGLNYKNIEINEIFPIRIQEFAEQIIIVFSKTIIP